MMTKTFIDKINDLIDEAILEAPADELEREIGLPGFPSTQEIQNFQNIITSAVQESRRARLQAAKQAFQERKSDIRDQITLARQRNRSISGMITDIVSAIAKKREQMPEGLTLAFRNESKEVSDDTIRATWEKLVKLGLIDPDEDM